VTIYRIDEISFDENYLRVSRQEDKGVVKMSRHDDGSSDIGAFLAGFVIGGLVGAATALILAPQSGEQTRAQLAAKGEELRQAGEERLGQYREMADTYTHEYRARAEDALEEARSRIKETSDQVQERARIVLDEGKTKISDAIESGKERVAQVKGDVADRVQGDEQSSQGDAPAST
jgi:gas vesicle protein